MMTVNECKRVLTITLLKDVRYRIRTPEQCYIDLVELNRMPDDKIKEYYNLFFTRVKKINKIKKELKTLKSKKHEQ